MADLPKACVFNLFIFLATNASSVCQLKQNLLLLRHRANAEKLILCVADTLLKLNDVTLNKADTVRQRCRQVIGW
jgi:hypothetical protein